MAILRSAENGNIIVSGNPPLPLDCATCPCHSNGCMSTMIPDSLKFFVLFDITGGSNPDYAAAAVDLNYDANACGSGPGWNYSGGDVCIGPNFDLRAVTLCCGGTDWNIEIVLVNNGIQDDFQNPSALTDPSVVDEDPVYITTSSTSSSYDVPGLGSGQLNFYIMEQDAVPPSCGLVGCASLPASLTINYLINGTISGSFSAPQTTGLAYASGNVTICDNGGGNVVIASFTLAYVSGTTWHITFSVQRNAISGFVSGLDWDETFDTGQVYDGITIDCLSGTYDRMNTGRSGASVAYSCGGDSYPFNGAAGTVNLFLTF